MSRSDDSVRPSQPNNSVEVGDGLGGGAGRRHKVRGRRGAGFCATFDACPCCPIDAPEDIVAPNVDVDNDELIVVEEQEPAEMPLVLPNVYQPTRSEYLDHCVTKLDAMSDACCWSGETFPHRPPESMRN